MKLLSIILYLIILNPAHGLECSDGKYPVSGHSRTAYYRTDGTHVSEADVSSYCKNYRSDGPLKVKFQMKIPKDWPFKNEIFKKCTVNEQKNIAEIFSTLPKILTQVGELKIFCAKKSATEDNPATSAPTKKIIVLYSAAFKTDLKRILIHELAHLLYGFLSTKERKQYWRVAEWIDSNQTESFTTKRTSFSALDGKYDPEEDFANNVEYFYAEQEFMIKNFPSITKWLSKFLGDKQ
ncbi:MAG: hypothetical protein A2381_17720 [Bdellovibrionales bacterium RIFOXYB1_FULL_37_110]|nr:MAG: hypothetical protein A2417_08510 [Bdellovibrionales bacterium RIFOXYC1_FULL_37_79]OFZ59811.1 MAG: hypothetical protein A2381_17720 [Bdellovibrionales bacterium RIFOXYB1_FULL_37_110]OFZ65426.1 MAG: hypothetical protein A2577_18255 [Bdellovibrionales bacterium RIFOXYD1_FULL_36_51]